MKTGTNVYNFADDGSQTILARPHIIVICGSTRFRREQEDANALLSLNGFIVVASSVWKDSQGGPDCTEDQKAGLDLLHFRKIEMADEVFVVNPGGYIGDSTRNEITYARTLGKPIEFLEPAGYFGEPMGEGPCDNCGHEVECDPGARPYLRHTDSLSGFCDRGSNARHAALHGFLFTSRQASGRGRKSSDRR